MAAEINPNRTRNAGCIIANPMKVKGVVVGVGEMNQGREISMEEAAALLNKKRAYLLGKVNDIDSAIDDCNQEIEDLSESEDDDDHLDQKKRTLRRKKGMYNRYINALDDCSIELEEAILSLEIAKIKSIVESARRNAKPKVESRTS